MFYPFKRSLGWFTVALLLFGFGCSPDKAESSGELVISVTTDLEIPKDLTHIGIRVTGANEVEHQNWYPLGSDPKTDEQLPATLVLEPGSTDDPVTIGVYGRRDSTIVSLREVKTTVPRNRSVLLRMPVEWLSLGMVQPTDEASDSAEVSFDSVESSCGSGKTAKAGSCVAATVDSNTLPTYTSSKVFGDGTGSGDGTCFDVGTCFESYSSLTIVDSTNCIATVDTAEIDDFSNFSLGLMVLDGSGVCGPSGCVVPLDSAMTDSSVSGWTADQQGIHLPVAVCERLGAGSARAVIASTECPTKVAQMPTCGAWSNIGTDTETPAGYPDILTKCREFATAACEGLSRCRGGLDFMPTSAQADGSCSERATLLCDASLATEDAESYLSYFENCLSAVQEEDCGTFEKQVQKLCVEPSGTLGKGASCSFGQCKSGLSCVGAIPNGTGTCTARLEVDASGCATGATVDALLPQGACDSGLICGSEDVCLVPAAEDESCVSNLDCELGLTCLAGICVEALDEGSNCTDDTECAAGLHCIASGSTSKCRGPGAEGDSCELVVDTSEFGTAMWQTNLCDASVGLRCDSSGYTCEAIESVEIGAACTTLNLCVDGYCSGLFEGKEKGTCTAYVADGSRCNASSECAPPSECLGGKCRLRPAFGLTALTMQVRLY